MKIIRALLPAIVIGALITAITTDCLIRPIYKKGRYYNNKADMSYKHIDLWRIVKMVASRMVSPTAWKELLSPAKKQQQPAAAETIVHLPKPIQSIPAASSQEPVITWIGHATFLIQVNGFNILTDPIFGDVKVLSDPGNWVPKAFTLTKRTMKPGIKLKDLPHIDAIVISHNHSDHTDTESLMALQKKFDPQVFVPKGNKELFTSFGFTKIEEMSWWEGKVIDKESSFDKLRTSGKINITCVPAFHWSIRFGLDGYRRSLWSGWMFTYNNKNIYFAGDTAYGPHFKEIGQQFPNIEIALLPIGPTDKQEGVNPHKECHVDATEAVQVFRDLNANCFVPMHFATFFASEHAADVALTRLVKHWNMHDDLKNKKLLIAQCGKQYALQ